jgi:hypothetical protein
MSVITSLLGFITTDCFLAARLEGTDNYLCEFLEGLAKQMIFNDLLLPGHPEVIPACELRDPESGDYP